MALQCCIANKNDKAFEGDKKVPLINLGKMLSWLYLAKRGAEMQWAESNNFGWTNSSQVNGIQVNGNFELILR